MPVSPEAAAAKRTAAEAKSAAARWMSQNPMDSFLPRAAGPVDPLRSWRQVWAMQEEMLRFYIQRAERYQSLFHQLRACDTPIAAAKICTEAAQTTVADYVDEAQRVSRAATEAVGPDGASQARQEFQAH